MKLNFNVINGENIVFVYVNLFDNILKWFFDVGNGIVRKYFVEGGNVIFCFDLEFMFEQGEYLILYKQGIYVQRCSFVRFFQRQ